MVLHLLLSESRGEILFALIFCGREMLNRFFQAVEGKFEHGKNLPDHLRRSWYNPIPGAAWDLTRRNGGMSWPGIADAQYWRPFGLASI